MSHYDSTRGSKTVTIGELYLHIKACDLSAIVLDTVVASEFEVEIEFDFLAGYEGNTTGRWEDAEPHEPDSLNIVAIKAANNVHFAGDASDLTLKEGTDLKDMFTGAQVAALEDQVLAMIQKGGGDD